FTAVVSLLLPVALRVSIDGMIATSPYTGTFNAAFARVRELSASYTLPQAVTNRMRASRATLNVAARNLWFLYRAQTDVSGAPIQDRKSTRLNSSHVKIS